MDRGKPSGRKIKEVTFPQTYGSHVLDYIFKTCGFLSLNRFTTSTVRLPRPTTRVPEYELTGATAVHVQIISHAIFILIVCGRRHVSSEFTSRHQAAGMNGYLRFYWVAPTRV